MFWAKDDKLINELAIALRKQGLLLEQEDDAAGFLGVRLETNADDKLEMRQETGLIDRVIDTMGSDTKLSKNKWTLLKPLVRNEDGEPFSAEFSYASVVGMPSLFRYLPKQLA